MNLLYFGKAVKRESRAGREILCDLNYRILSSLYQPHLLEYRLTTKTNHSLKWALNIFRGYIDGIDEDQLTLAIDLVQANHVKCIFVDGSNLGAFVYALKIRFPSVEVITFCHNVEAKFFWDAFCSNLSIRSCIVFIANMIAELKAVSKSDKIISLSQRDSSTMKRLYGRGATHISSLAIADSLEDDAQDKHSESSEKCMLFVGGTFYANIKAVEWYAKYVAPKVRLPLYIVGHGFEKLRTSFSGSKNVVVIGSVNSLTLWYRRAHVVVAPILQGSGMKTKVAESLMHGKKIIGTPKAFSGYEQIVQEIGWSCRDANEFISAVNNAESLSLPQFDMSLRAIYEQNYSYEAARSRLASILS